MVVLIQLIKPKTAQNKDQRRGCRAYGIGPHHELKSKESGSARVVRDNL